MATRIGRGEIGSWKNKALRLRARMRASENRTRRTVETVVHTTEVSSAAFVAGLVQGRYGGIEVLGVPMDLGLAAVLHVAAFAGLGGKMSSHLHGFGDGFLAAFLTTTGRGVGQELLKKKGAAATTSGMLPGGNAALPGGGAFLTEDDRRMAAMAANI